MDDLASSSWQNPSQSFGCNPQQQQLQAKNPFAAAAANAAAATSAATAAAAAAAYRIRWHNTVPKDFGHSDEIGSYLKRSASTALPENDLMYPDQLATLEQDTVPTTTVSPTQTHPNPPTKRRKPSTSTAASSPVKPKKAAAVAATSSPSSSPLDPSAVPVKRRRGRPPKHPVPVLGASEIAFVTEIIPGMPVETEVGIEPFQPAPTQSSHPVRPHSSPVLQPLDTFVTYPNAGLTAMAMESLGDADFQQNKYWDASFAGSMISDHGHMTTSFVTMPGDIDLVSAVSATTAFDWSVPTSLDMMASQSMMMDPMRPMSMHNPLAESFFADPSHNPHALNFSFAADPMSASDIISPISINPGIVFGGEHFGGSFTDGVEPFRPYHQQNLQQQQEQQDEQRKRQRKTVPVEAQAQPNSKTASAASRPGLSRALTESAILTTSASKSKASNVTVHPSPVKQMFTSTSGKMRSVATRDENTTPSPSVDTVSVRQITPKSSEKKHKSSRKVRTTVNFSISPGGRAKAERVIIRDPDSQSEGSGSDHDHGEYDTDSSTDEDDLGPLSSYSMAAQRLAGSKGRSHRGSSSFSRSMERPKLARFKTAPARESFSSSSQYLVSGDFTSDSFGLDNNPFLPPNMSMSSGIHKSPRKSGKHSRGSRRHSRNSSSFSMKSHGTTSRTNLGSMREEDEYSEAETVIDEPTPAPATPGDAVVALKEAVARRNSFCAPGPSSKRPSSSSYGTSRPSTRHTNALPSSPPAQQQQLPYGFSTPQTVRSGYSSDAFNISPTTVTDPDCVTPTTVSKQQAAGQDIAMDIRCRCSLAGSPEMPVLQW
ncbi:hypothetical protein ABW21_db0205673 [Orbilia brochopaga]|nr:hypothetical protein ABW21_db0205673 [Drechslerella brochopaga]